MHRNAAPETEVVTESVQRHHCPAVRKIPLPAGQGACAQQGLTIKHSLHIDDEKAVKHPIRVWPFNFFEVHKLRLLFLQPSLCFSQGFEPKRAFIGVKDE